MKNKRIITIITLILTAVFVMGCGKTENKNNDGVGKMVLYNKPYILTVDINKSGDETFADIYSAIERSKQLKDSALLKDKDAVVIKLADGRYNINSAIKIGGEHNIGVPLVIEGSGADKVILDGGKQFKGGWNIYDSDKNIYRLKLEDVVDFRQLYIEDNPGIRARYPNDTKDLRADYLQLFWDETNRRVGVESYVLDDISCDAIKDSELFFVQEWTQSIGHISADEELADDDGKIYFSFNEQWFNDMLFTRHAPIRNSVTNRCWFENSLEFLDMEKEWFYDSETKFLYYKPESGTDINNLTFSVPQTETLLSIEGDHDSFAENLYITGLTLANTNWNHICSSNYLDGQAGLFRSSAFSAEFSQKAPAAVFATFAKNVVLYKTVIKNTGAYGLNFDVGVKDSKLVSSTISNCATSGVNVGYYGEKNAKATSLTNGYVPRTQTEITENIVLENNLIEKIGTSFKGGSTGIVAGYTRNLDIIHNEINDVSYSGVAIGWGWEWKNVINCNININYNRITDVMNHLPFDGAPIYLLGKQVATLEGSQIIGNYIEVENGLGGIYFDNSSSVFTLRQNVINGTGRLGLIDLHDWNYLLRNITVTETYAAYGEIFVHHYWQNVGSMPYKDINAEPPSLISRNIVYDEPIYAFKDGKWSEDAQKIIDEAGRK